MAKRSYETWCPGCGSEWPGLDADDSSLNAGEVVALATCEECVLVTTTIVKQPSRELEKLRRETMKTVQKICQSYVRAHTRLEERRRVLAREIHDGNTEHVDTLREVERRLSSLKPPDTSLLENRAEMLKAALTSAPKRQTLATCSDCGEPMNVHRETHRGFTAPCPKCTHKLMVRLEVR